MPDSPAPDNRPVTPDDFVVVEQDGVRTAIPRAVYEARQAAGAGTEGEALGSAKLGRGYQERVKEQIYGDLGDRAITALEGGLAGATLGLSDLAARGLASDEYLEDARARADVNPGTRLAGELVGGALPALASGGAGSAGALARATPAGAVARLAAGRGIVGAAIEGAAGGAGAGLSQIALSEDPLTLERAASVISSNALLGAGIGAGAGLLGKAAEKGIQRAKALADEAGEAARSSGAVADDLAGLDKAGLRTARETELAKLADDAKVAKAGAADELATYRTELKAANPFLASDDATTRKLFVAQERQFRRLLDEPIGLAENPRKALDPLRREATALRKAIDDRATQEAKIAADSAKLADEVRLDLDTLPDAAQTVTLTGKTARRYGDWADTKVPKKVIEVTREEADAFEEALRSGEIASQRTKSLDALDGLLKKNEALQAKITASFEPPKSARLEAIDTARDQLGAKSERGILETASLGYGATAVTGLLPGGPLAAIGAIAAPKVLNKLADLVTGRLAKASAASAKTGRGALDRFFSGTQTATRAMPRAASQVLATASFSDARPASLPSTGDSLADAYRERERELRASTTPGADGRPTLTPAAREAVADRLRGVTAVSPALADTLETMAARRASFLASKLPYRPDAAAFQLGPDTWRPSEFEIRQFARYVDSVEQPDAIEDRLADGTLTPEDAEVMREVYPERYGELKNALIQRLPELKTPLPYERRLSLSIFFDLPVDASTSPEVIAALQANFAAEPESAGGTQAPRPKPAFGSVSRPEPTPAQERAA